MVKNTDREDTHINQVIFMKVDLTTIKNQTINATLYFPERKDIKLIKKAMIRSAMVQKYLLKFLHKLPILKE